jgi:hypothetical protein
LLDAQNEFLAIWVNQEALRLNLDLDLGTMQLDGRGIWVDPGAVGQPATGDGDLPAERPQPMEPLPPAILPTSPEEMMRS